MSTKAPSPVEASPQVHALLDRLHKASSDQEKALSQKLFYITRFGADVPLGRARWSRSGDAHMRDRFRRPRARQVRVRVPACGRAAGARRIVEAGTSFGVSTIYLALAVGQNVADAAAVVEGKVIATEKEPTKAARAREHWREAGAEVEHWGIELRRATFSRRSRSKRGCRPEIDMVLLDSKYDLRFSTCT